MSRHVEFLIIGQGLAGSLLAWTLLQRQRSVLIVDTGLENASQVAAGIINPVTGLRLVKSPDVAGYLPHAMDTYAALSKTFKQHFYFEKPMLRIFRSDSEAKQAQKRLLDPDYQPYLYTDSSADAGSAVLNTPYGSLLQKQTGHLNTTRLLACLKAFFIQQGCYQQSQFHASELNTRPTLQWREVTTDWVVFCEGYQAISNPWFAWLPLQPVKGEIVTLQFDSALALPDTLINYGHWLLPLVGQTFRLGATFDREHCDTQTTAQGKAELLNGLKSLLRQWPELTVLHHQANLRPCTLDRQPLIGFHPQQPRLAMFNGFGAKGSLQVPWCCEHFANALLQGADLEPVVDIRRFYARYSTVFG